MVVKTHLHVWPSLPCDFTESGFDIPESQYSIPYKLAFFEYSYIRFQGILYFYISIERAGQYRRSMGSLGSTYRRIILPSRGAVVRVTSTTRLMPHLPVSQ